MKVKPQAEQKVKPVRERAQGNRISMDNINISQAPGCRPDAKRRPGIGGGGGMIPLPGGARSPQQSKPGNSH